MASSKSRIISAKWFSSSSFYLNQAGFVLTQYDPHDIKQLVDLINLIQGMAGAGADPSPVLGLQSCSSGAQTQDLVLMRGWRCLAKGKKKSPNFCDVRAAESLECTNPAGIATGWFQSLITLQHEGTHPDSYFNTVRCFALSLRHWNS